MRRHVFLAGTGAALAAPSAAAAVAVDEAGARRELATLETRSGGRLGVYALDPASGVQLAHRPDERFPMCSTFKVLAVAALLARVDRGAERLDRRIPITRADLLAYAPIARKHVARGSMTLAEACSAVLVWSDNTAANLVLAALGGPAAVTRFARALGDPLTRLDRNEPSLNSALPGDTRDTTTARSMVRDWRTLLLGTALAPSSRRLLLAGLIECRTGTARIRAGLPGGWRAGDKTGSGENGTSNDVAILFPPKRAPILVAAYLTGARVNGDARDATLASVGRIVVSAYAQ